MNLRRRVVLGVGRAQERRLLDVLNGDTTLQLAARCTSAPELFVRVKQDSGDVLVLDDDLHLLDDERLQDLTRRRRVPIVLLVHDPDGARWRGLRAVVLPWTASATEIRDGIDRAIQRRFARPETSAGVVEAAAASLEVEHGPAADDRSARVVACFGGAGAPGRTTLAVNLLAVLGATRRAVLVDLDLTGAAVAAYLRAVHPAWNIVDVALARPQTSDAWEQMLDGRLQSIGTYSRGARVLCGVARPQQRSHVTAGFVEQLIGQLAERFEHVLLDLGDEPLSGAGPESMIAAAALGAADHVLLVAAADPLSVHHAQLAREEAANVLDPERTALVVNRCDSSQDAASSAAALRLPLVGVIPTDARIRQALADGHPAVCNARSRVRRPIAQLAERVAAASLQVPEIQDDTLPTRRYAGFRSLLAPLSSVLGGVRS